MITLQGDLLANYQLERLLVEEYWLINLIKMDKSHPYLTQIVNWYGD